MNQDHASKLSSRSSRYLLNDSAKSLDFVGIIGSGKYGTVFEAQARNLGLKDLDISSTSQDRSNSQTIYQRSSRSLFRSKAISSTPTGSNSSTKGTVPSLVPSPNKLRRTRTKHKSGIFSVGSDIDEHDTGNGTVVGSGSGAPEATGAGSISSSRNSHSVSLSPKRILSQRFAFNPLNGNVTRNLLKRVPSLPTANGTQNQTQSPYTVAVATNQTELPTTNNSKITSLNSFNNSVSSNLSSPSSSSHSHASASASASSDVEVDVDQASLTVSDGPTSAENERNTGRHFSFSQSRTSATETGSATDRASSYAVKIIRLNPAKSKFRIPTPTTLKNKLNRHIQTKSSKKVTNLGSRSNNLGGLKQSPENDGEMQPNQKITKALISKLKKNNKPTDMERAQMELQYLEQFAECPFIVELQGYYQKFPSTINFNFSFNFNFNSNRHNVGSSGTSLQGSRDSKQLLAKELWVVTELYDKASSVRFNAKARRELKLDVEGIKTVVASVLLGLKYLHEKGYAHRDLKPHNILIKSNSRTGKIEKAVLCDFGACSGLSAEQVPVWKGTFGFLSPEYLKFCEARQSFQEYMAQSSRDYIGMTGGNLTAHNSDKRLSERLISLFYTKHIAVSNDIGETNTNKNLNLLEINARTNSEEGQIDEVIVTDERVKNAEPYLKLLAGSAGVDIWGLGITLLGWMFGINPLLKKSVNACSDIINGLYRTTGRDSVLSSLINDPTDSETLDVVSKYKMEQCFVDCYDEFYATCAPVDRIKLSELKEKSDPFEGSKNSDKDAQDKSFYSNYFAKLLNYRVKEYPELCDMISSCLILNPKERATAAQLCEHKFVADEVKILQQVYPTKPPRT